MSIDFPINPDNGMVFEASEGMFFEFNKPANTWTRLDGFENISPATISEPGLMTKDDFKKIEGLLLPPITTTISTQECGTTFTNGRLELISSDSHLDIDVKLDLFKGKKSETKVDFVIHENTFGIDFKINVKRLIDELTSRGRLSYRSSRGPAGDQGDRGDPGIDNLDTGPQGLPGPNGKNAPYGGSLAEDFNAIKVTSSKAIVDIKNDENDPLTLVVTIGNIGNPNSCPSQVNFVPKNSPWLVATSDAAPVICPASVGCRICDTQLYYIDIGDMLSEIDSRYQYIINNIKSGKESLVRVWLNKLIELFNEQKQALCCAIEALSSKQKNQEIRNIMSDNRSSTAGAGYAFSVSSGPASPSDLKPRSVPQCTPESVYPPPQSTDPAGEVISNGSEITTFDCNSCFVQATLRAGNVGQSNALKFSIPAGSYVVTIMQCCLNYNSYGSTGVYNIKYIDGTYKSLDRGTGDRDTADQLYVGDSLSFTQSEYGEVSIWADSFINTGIDGEIILCIQPTSCFANCQAPSMAANIIDSTCSMAVSHLKFYERGWTIGECCAAYVSIHGTGFLVIYKSIGLDLSCGGGESNSTPCISKFNGILGDQVAIAWPTIDGETFFGLSQDQSSTVEMVYDKDLSRDIINAINTGNVYKKFGDPKSIAHVIVPIVL